MGTVVTVLLLLGAYVVGSFPTGLLLARAQGVDLRQVGSGNIGATNVGRALGRGWGVLVLIVDAAKGFLPVLLARAAGPVALGAGRGRAWRRSSATASASSCASAAARAWPPPWAARSPSPPCPRWAASSSTRSCSPRLRISSIGSICRRARLPPPGLAARPAPPRPLRLRPRRRPAGDHPPHRQPQTPRPRRRAARVVSSPSRTRMRPVHSSTRRGAQGASPVPAPVPVPVPDLA